MRRRGVPEVPGVLTGTEVLATAEHIAGRQEPCGAISWPDGHTDAWDHVECAMALSVCGLSGPARRAYDVGFVNRVVPNGTHIQEAIAMGHELAEMAPLVLGTLKRFVNYMIMPIGPIERMVETSIAIARVRGSADLKEGVAAHKEKRKPRFTGR